jgi:GH15 family glucan-1,4-alpha-glucosidase
VEIKTEAGFDPMTRAIEDHGIIGDLRTAALVATDGTVDFLCWPQFDSPSIFAGLLDEAQGGAFELAPTLDGARHRQLYLPDTNVLLTRFLSETGVAEISDFMTIGDGDQPSRLFRRVKAIRNTIAFSMRCAPRFDYARGHHVARADRQCVLFEADQGPRLRLWSDAPMTVSDGVARADFSLNAGESAFFVLDDQAVDGPGYTDDDVTAALQQTVNYWHGWVSQSTYKGRWQDVVTRSALVLKLLTSAQHGSMVAALTFGLPEQAGGSRNWDYRYTWLRDAAFMVYAFLRLGYKQEAIDFMRWMTRTTTKADTERRVQILYGIDGRLEAPETELPGLRGYLDSRPVRIGNAAHSQRQLDIHGELMDALYLADKYADQVTWETWDGVVRAMNQLKEEWQSPDEGIWELRNGRRHLLHSRMMCWVAFDRAIRLSRKRGLPAPIVAWIEARDAIYNEIHRDFWDPEQKSFVQSKGGKALDAACLQMPLMRFISPTDPRWLSTLAAIGEQLVDDSLVYRYTDDDGLDGTEGTFNMCSFWYVECLARSGELERARFLFEKMLGYANHLGLYAEQLGKSGEHLGNFPQAFTHLSLISAAYYLEQASPARQR